MGREKNNFTYIWGSCLTFILVICVFGVISDTKETYSTNNYCYMTSTGETCIALDSTMYGEYQIVRPDRTEFGNARNNMTSTLEDMLLHIPVKFMYDGVSYAGITFETVIGKNDGILDAYSYEYIRFTNESSSKEILVCDWGLDDEKPCDLSNSEITEPIIITVSSPQKMSVNSFNLIGTITEPVNSCNYNKYSNDFTWTHMYVGAKRNEYASVDSCNKARAVVLNDSTGSITIDGWETPHNYFGSVGDEFSVEKYYAKNSSVSLTRKGYTLKGWSTQENGGGVFYEHNATFSLQSNLTLYAQWEAVNETINDYKIDENEKVIFVPMGTTKTELEKNIVLGAEHTLNIDYKYMGGNQMLYTGGKVQILNSSDNSIYKEYTLSVLGDTNGDGEMSTMDYINIYNHLDNSKSLTGAFLMAADMNQDDDITTMDYIMMYNKLGGN